MRHLLAVVWTVCCCSMALSQSVEQMSAAASTGNWAVVETMAKARTRRAPEDATAWTFLGLAYDNLGQAQQALDAFARAVKLAPGDAPSHTNYGAALEHAGRKQAAATEYARSLRINPKQPSALVNLARLDAEDGITGRAKALGYLREAWKLAPDAEIAASLLIVEPCVDLVSDVYVARVADAAVLEPGLRLQAAHAMEGCSRWAEAEKIFRAALAGGELATEQREIALTGVARAEIRQGRMDEAEAGLNAAIEGGSETPKLLAALAEVEQQRGHYELAVPALMRAEAIAPEDEDLRFRYGMLLLDARTPKAAELRTHEALERFPNSSALWFLLGLSYFDQDETALARDALDHALKLQPRFSAALAYRGLAASGEEHYTEAAAYYRKAIDVEPGSAELHCLLAEVLEKEHREDAGPAYAELERAVAIDPSLARSYLMMGRIDLDRGKPERAIEELQKAIELKSPSDQAHFFLARAYRQTHQIERAAQESDLFAKLAAASRTQERDAVEQALRQLAHTPF